MVHVIVIRGGEEGHQGPSRRHLDSGRGVMTVKMIVCHQKTIVSHPPTKCPHSHSPHQLVARCTVRLCDSGLSDELGSDAVSINFQERN